MKENCPHPKFKMTFLQARYVCMKRDFIQNDKHLSLGFRRTDATHFGVILEFSRT